MGKKICLLSLIASPLILTSCSYDIINGIDVFDLPWRELTLRNLEFSTIMFILYLSFGLRLNYREIFRSRWAGKKIMKMTLKTPNYPFWIFLIGWIVLIWLWVIGFNNEVQFLTGLLLSRELIEGMLILLILRKGVIFVTLLNFIFFLNLRILRQPEIREKGIIHELVFIPWEHVVLAEWKEPGELAIHCRWTSKSWGLFFWEKNKKQTEKEANHYLMIKPEQEAEANKHLQKFIPDSM